MRLKSLPLEFVIAGRYLRARKSEGFVSVIAGFSFLGIMLGVATLIIVMSVMNGFQSELLTRLLGMNGHVTIIGAQTGIPDYEVIASRAAKTMQTDIVTPMIEKQGLVSANNVSSGVIVRGIDRDALHTVPILLKGSNGNPDDFTGDNVWIGSVMAQNMGLKLGDDFALLSPQGRSTPFGSMPKSLQLRVAGIFDVGMYEYNSGFVFMPLKTAQAFYEMPYRVSQISIQTDEPIKSHELKPALTEALKDYPVAVQDWRDSNQSYFNALAVERNVMFLILTLIIIVAAFNVISGMIMMVKDKTRDIAILRTMGASRRMILKVFILTGAAIGVLGTLAGTILGTVFALNIEGIRQFLQSLSGTDLFSAEVYFLSQLPAEVQAHEVVLITVMSLILSFLATIYPAWRAASVDPVEALRYG